MLRERRASQAQRNVVAIGLTGSIGAGKSTALAMFAERGLTILSADELVHRLYQRSEVSLVVAEHFGREVLGADDSVDRGSLAEMVRGKSDELHWLEDLTHPLVAEEIERHIQGLAPGSMIVCEVPLMFETGFQRLFDLVVTVEAGQEVRRDRSIQSFGLDQFGELETLQASREQRVSGSDMVFVNDGTMGDLRAFVNTVCEHACQMLTPALRGGC